MKNGYIYTLDVFEGYRSWIEGNGGVNEACKSVYSACHKYGSTFVYDVIWLNAGILTWPKLVECGPEYMDEVIDLYSSEEERKKEGEHFRISF